MDSEFLPSQNFELAIQTLTIDRIVLFAHSSSAELFLHQIYPSFCNCIVASADRVFPRDPALNQSVFSALENRTDLRIAIFNLGALKAVKVASERIFVLDDLIMQDFKKHPLERELRLSLSTEKIIFLLETFFSQWEKMQRIGNVDFAYHNYIEFDDTKFDWKASLILDTPDKIEGQDQLAQSNSPAKAVIFRE